MDILRFKKIKYFVRAALFILTASFLLSACGGDETENKAEQGNLSDVFLEPGDIYAVFDINGYGEITFKLFPDIAPIAVERFTALAERGYYDSKNIHRVVKDFITQGGSLYGDGTDGELQSGESFELETSDNARNFYGALCMAPSNDKKNCYQFYIVNNSLPVDIDADIQTLEAILGDTTKELKPESKARYEKHLADMKALPETVKELYKSKGGVFRLDGSNTVFGQMLEGKEVLDTISQVETVAGNQIDDLSEIRSKPLDDIIINTVRIVRIPLPEPTETTTEETTKKGKKKTTSAAETEDNQLTDVVAFGDTTTAPPDNIDNTDNIGIITDTENNPAETISEDVSNEAPINTPTESSEEIIQSEVDDSAQDSLQDSTEVETSEELQETPQETIEETLSNTAEETVSENTTVSE